MSKKELKSSARKTKQKYVKPAIVSEEILEREILACGPKFGGPCPAGDPTY